MWRNLLFAGFCLAALAAFGASLAPLEQPAARSQVARRQLDAPARLTVAKVNAAFRRRWLEAGVEPAPPADDLTVARRLSLALMGTIPSLEELRLLEAHRAEDRLAWWLAGTLADPRSSDYLAERLARAYVGTGDGPFLIYRRRRFVTWLSDQLAANRPYDRLVADMLASRGLWTSQPATNFVMAAVPPGQVGKGPDESALAARVSRAFLGIRLDCAECHDHPFADWKQNDFHRLAALFGEAEVGRKEKVLAGLYDRRAPFEIENRFTGEMLQPEPAVPYQQELLGQSGPLRQRLARWMTSAENAPFSRAIVNRTWAILLGRPLVEPIDDIPSDNVPEVLDLLSDDFAAHGFDLQRLIAQIASTEVFRLNSRAGPGQELTAAHEQLWAVFPLTQLRPEQVIGSIQQATSLTTLDRESNILTRTAQTLQQAEFVKRYGDPGDDEFMPRASTTGQRLLLMNGALVTRTIREGFFGSATSQIATLAQDDAKAVEIAYLAVLSRQPTPQERAHFAERLAGTDNRPREQAMEDMYWALVNSTEFSWNH